MFYVPLRKRIRQLDHYKFIKFIVMGIRGRALLAPVFVLIIIASASDAFGWGRQIDIFEIQTRFAAVFPGVKPSGLEVRDVQRDLTPTVIKKYSSYDPELAEKFAPGGREDLSDLQVPVFKFGEAGYVLGFSLSASDFFIFFDHQGTIKDYWVTAIDGANPELELFRKEPFRQSLRQIGRYPKFASFDEKTDIQGPWLPQEIMNYVQTDASLERARGLEKFDAEVYPGQDKLRHYLQLRHEVLREFRFALYLSKHLLFERN